MRNENAAQDARLILQLDRLRDEAEMRKARRWWRDEFRPRNAADYLKIESSHGSQENKWLRQVATFWGMAASFVLDGTLSEEALLRPEFSDEMFAIFAKVRPFLKQLRTHTRNPEFMANVEKVILGSKTGKERLREAAKHKRSASKAGASLPNFAGAQKQLMRRKGKRQRSQALFSARVSAREAPLAGSGEKLQSDRKLVLVRGNAVDHPRP
jgi:hypothetical protein